MRSQVAALIALALLLILPGCAGTKQTAFDPRGCPMEKAYTREHQAKIAAALPKTPPVIQSVVADYGDLRDKARVCRGETPDRRR